jgi:hypothetical protein
VHHYSDPMLHRILVCLVALTAPLAALDFQALNQPCNIAVPDAWDQVDTKESPSTVKLILRGKGDYDLPPTMNVAVEQVAATMSLNQYLECVQTLHKSNPTRRCSVLGALPGGREPLQLVQVEMESPWGPVNMLQAIMVRDKIAYVITASARQEEFGQQLPTFIKTLQSFTTVAVR